MILAPALRVRVVNELPMPITAPPLTPDDLSVLKLLAASRSDVEIAEALHMTTDVVQTTVRHIQQKLSVPTRLLAVLRATQLGFIEP